MKAQVGAHNQEKALVGAFSVIVKTDCCRWIVCSPGCCRQVPGSVLHGAGETHRCWSWSDHSDSPLPISRHSTSTSRQRKGHQTFFQLVLARLLLPRPRAGDQGAGHRVCLCSPLLVVVGPDAADANVPAVVCDHIYPASAGSVLTGANCCYTLLTSAK